MHASALLNLFRAILTMKVLIFLSLLLPVIVNADTVAPAMPLVYQGKTYREAFAVGVKTTEVRFFSTQDGSVTVPWKALPVEWQTALKKKYEEARAREVKQSMSAEAKAAGALPVFGTVLQKLPEGLLLTNAAGEVRLLKGFADQARVANGETVGSWAIPAGTVKFKNALGEEQTAPAFKTTTLDP